MSAQKDKDPRLGVTIQANDFQAPDGIENLNEPVLNQHSDRGMLASKSSAPWWYSQFNLMLCVFGLLGVCALVFVFMTPTPQKLSQKTLINAQGGVFTVESGVVDQGSLPDRNTNEIKTPFDDAQQAQARADSQDSLENVLALQKTLTQKNVVDWAEPQFNAALALASEGDSYYKQQDYFKAVELYKKSETALKKIVTSMPDELDRQVAIGLQAIDQGQAIIANQHFEAALSLDPNHIPALQGLQRVETLDQVLTLVSSGASFEKKFSSSDRLNDIQEAIKLYEKALALDSEWQPAMLGVQRTQRLETDKQYRLSMSKAFKALFADRYSTATKHFNQALRHKPQDTIAASALRQSLASNKRTTLKSLLNDARDSEQQELWENALLNYQAVLQRDANQVSAKVGQIRSKARLEVDTKLKAILNDPLSATKSGNRERAKSLLNEARAIVQQGPVLKQQIAALDTLLSSLDSTVKVALSSDSLTNVSLKAADSSPLELGRFDLKKLAIKPGYYTLIGTRLGYKDVYLEFVVDNKADDILSIKIACEETVVSALKTTG